MKRRPTYGVPRYSQAALRLYESELTLTQLIEMAKELSANEDPKLFRRQENIDWAIWERMNDAARERDYQRPGYTGRQSNRG